MHVSFLCQECPFLHDPHTQACAGLAFRLQTMHLTRYTAWRSHALLTRDDGQGTRTVLAPDVGAQLTTDIYLDRRRCHVMASPIGQRSAQASTHLHLRGRRQPTTVAQAVKSSQIQERSSLVTGPNGSNGWAWILSGFTLTTGTALPALYLASQWQQVWPSSFAVLSALLATHQQTHQYQLC